MIKQKYNQDIPSLHGIQDLVQKYIDECYTSSSGEKLFRVSTQMKILKEFCFSNNLVYRIFPHFVHIGNLNRTVVTGVILQTLDGVIIAETFGTSTKYSFSLDSSITQAATESAETISLGKALSKLGITPGALHTKEEMEVFDYLQRNIRDKSLTTKAAQLVSKLPENLKEMAKRKNIGLDTILDLVDVNKDDENILAERLSLYLNSEGQGSQDSTYVRRKTIT